MYVEKVAEKKDRDSEREKERKATIKKVAKEPIGARPVTPPLPGKEFKFNGVKKSILLAIITI